MGLHSGLLVARRVPRPFVRTRRAVRFGGSLARAKQTLGRVKAMPGFGVLAERWWIPVLFIVIAGHITNVCVTLFLHRAQTHRGVRLHYLAALPMRLWLWLTTAIVTKEWVACHRKHH